MATLRSQEKAYLQHKQAVGGKVSDSEDAPQRGSWWTKNQNRKGERAASSNSGGDLWGTSGGPQGEVLERAKARVKERGPKETGRWFPSLAVTDARGATSSRTALCPMLLASFLLSSSLSLFSSLPSYF